MAAVGSERVASPVVARILRATLRVCTTLRHPWLRVVARILLATLRVCTTLRHPWLRVVARILRATLRVCTTLRHPWLRVVARLCNALRVDTTLHHPWLQARWCRAKVFPSLESIPSWRGLIHGRISAVEHSLSQRLDLFFSLPWQICGRYDWREPRFGQDCPPPVQPNSPPQCSAKLPPLAMPLGRLWTWRGWRRPWTN